MAQQSDAWKAFERVIATLFGSFRVPLSGINSRHNAGDVILPNDISMLIECKCRASSSHWTMFNDARKDAKKNGVDPLNTMLFLKVKYHEGSIVTMDTALFERIWAVPGVRDVLAKPLP